MLNALVFTNLFDAGHSVIGRGQAHFVGANGEARKPQAQTCTGMLNTGFIRSSLDNTRPDGTARGYDGVVG